MVFIFLMSDIFEPLESQNLHPLSKKDLFLVSLAAAKCLGELQAVSNVVSSLGEDVVLSYLPYSLTIEVGFLSSSFPGPIGLSLWQSLHMGCRKNPCSALSGL